MPKLVAPAHWLTPVGLNSLTTANTTSLTATDAV